jgi:hypothetical protein
MSSSQSALSPTENMVSAFALEDLSSQSLNVRMMDQESREIDHSNPRWVAPARWLVRREGGQKLSFLQSTQSRGRLLLDLDHHKS